MKEYRGPDGEMRLWYESVEVDTIMTTELVKAKLLPSAKSNDLTVDLEAFVESHLGVPLDQYAELEADVLGVTAFRRDEVPRISINRDLTVSALDDSNATPGLLGRWRATVAHEASHVLLHRRIFERRSHQHALFDLPERDVCHSELLRCLKRDVGFGQSHSDWKEVQANMGMGALLMPRPVFQRAVLAELERLGLTKKLVPPGSNEHVIMVERLARRFTVSKQAARIRLNSFRVLRSGAQATI